MVEAHTHTGSLHYPEFSPLRIGPLDVWPPVVLAPMAGVTDVPFRTLCRRFGAGLYVNQMITARGLVERQERTLKLAEFGPEESPRSIQLYGTDPDYLGRAVHQLVDEGGVDHIDMNFGCSVPKVTRHGGGSALPYKRPLLRRILRAAVAAADGRVPVTIKFRIGLDDATTTYLDTGRIAEEEGIAAIALHARTAEQFYSGSARWDAIGRLKETVTSIPVLGNGDIWEAADAVEMMRQTNCDGVVVGRGCLGRPWLFGDLADIYAGKEVAAPPPLGAVLPVLREHARLVVDWHGSEYPLRAFRKHAVWYLTGYPCGGAARARLNQITSLAELDDVLAGLDPSLTMPRAALRTPRSHSSGPRAVALPHGWLDDPDADVALDAAAEAYTSGG